MPLSLPSRLLRLIPKRSWFAKARLRVQNRSRVDGLARAEGKLEATMALAMDQRDGWIWFDGELKPWRDAKIHVLTHGLHYASCVFEGQRAYGGEVFKLREHTNRLINSGKILDFTIPDSADEIDAACRLVLEK